MISSCNPIHWIHVLNKLVNLACHTCFDSHAKYQLFAKWFVRKCLFLLKTINPQLWPNLSTGSMIWTNMIFTNTTPEDASPQVSNQIFSLPFHPHPLVFSLLSFWLHLCYLVFWTKWLVPTFFFTFSWFSFFFLKNMYKVLFLFTFFS